MTIKQMVGYLIRQSSKERLAADLHLSVRSIENYLSGTQPLRIVEEQIKELYQNVAARKS